MATELFTDYLRIPDSNPETNPNEASNRRCGQRSFKGRRTEAAVDGDKAMLRSSACPLHSTMLTADNTIL